MGNTFSETLIKYYCKDCGKEVCGKNRRCKSCASTGKNNPMFGKKRPEISGRNNYNWKTRINRNCDYCSKTILITTKRNKLKHIFCSRNCEIKWRKEFYTKNNPNYKHGLTHNTKCIDCGTTINFTCIRCRKCYYKNYEITDKTRKKMSLSHGGNGIPYDCNEYGKEFDSPLKEQVRFRDSYKCKVCGCSQLENGRQLHVHHIDYNKKNNDINNLIALCTSCHIKTNYNRNYWKKLFQEK